MVTQEKKSIRLGIDVGGTFTDIIAIDEKSGEVYQQFKIPSTPSDPAQAIIQAIAQVQHLLQDEHLEDLSITSLHHGTTVGTNALIQKKGARTVLITTEKFRDILELRRQIRPELYNFSQKISPPLIPRKYRIGIKERMDYKGNIITPLDEEQLKKTIQTLKEAKIESVAICTLHSYANSEHEQRIKEIIEENLPGVFVTCSSEVVPEFREFERTSTTAVNAYIGPEVSNYIKKIESNVKKAGIEEFRIVKSNGGLTSSENGRKLPAHFIESGPAACMTAVLHLSKQLGIKNVIGFDMGGTTAKVGVIKDGEPRITTEFYADQMVEGQLIGGYPIKSPVIDIVEIGAGGGSIARLDEAKVLKVGPNSAGADPGPACYGRGGTEPTITDAYAALGFLDPEAFNSGRTPLYPELAREVINTHIAKPLGWSIEKASYAILELATANMSEMVRLATVRRGLDIKDFILIPSGGAGPMHAGKIAKECGISEVIIPPLPGLLSAYGTLVSNIRHDLVQTIINDLSKMNPEEISTVFENLSKRGYELLDQENAPHTDLKVKKYMDLRFKGQVFEFPIEISDIPKKKADINRLVRDFEMKFMNEYGYVPNSKVELVNCRMELIAVLVQPDAPISFEGDVLKLNKYSRKVCLEDGSYRETPVFIRRALSVGEQLEGPAIIEDEGSTILIEEEQAFMLDSKGFLRINVGGNLNENNTVVSARSSNFRGH